MKRFEVGTSGRHRRAHQRSVDDSFVCTRELFATGDRVDGDYGVEGVSHRERGVWRKRRVVERTSRTGKARRKEVENANVHFFCFLLVRLSWSQHFMQTLPPGTFGELHQVTVLLDPHLLHVVPAAVKISLRCEERETRTARGESETNRGGERRAFAFA